MKRLFTIIFSLFCFVASVSAQNVKASQDKKARLEREIAIIDKQIAANASKSSSKLSELELLRKKIENRKALLDEADSEIRTYDAMISKAKKQMDALQARVDTLSEHYSRLVMSAYKNRDTRLWYMYILSSDNIAQAFRRMSYFKNLSNQMNADARRLQQAKDELAEQKEAMDALRSDAQKVRQERASELNRLKAEEAEANAVVRQLNRDKKKYQSQLASKKKEVEALNKELARLVAQSMKQQGGKSSKSDPQAVKLSSEFAKNKGKLPWPAEGPVVDHFGQRFHPVYKNLKLPPKNGIEVALDKDTQIKSVFDGVVKQIMVQPGYNICVIIQHGNYFSFYCRLKSTTVKAGDKVSTGQTIGVVDTMNGQTRLHLEIWQGSQPQNPLNWLR
ncbi:MAG: peptidoglycan DD-metalloendopeptidase family protein [Bacteroidales bacterium]|nr:peptidoglycan DD-metalloendopeptidase family protein [Bacteroidales bacterium]